MKRNMILSYLIIVLSALPSLVSSQDIQDAKWGQFPSIVHIVTSPHNANCTGTIIDTRHVITSAQCVISQGDYNLQNPFWYRIISDFNLQSRSVYYLERDVSHIFVHEGFNPKTLQHDLAVLRISEAFPFPHNTIEPTVLNTRIIPLGESLNLAVWYNYVQRFYVMNIRERDNCRDRFMDLELFESSLCTGRVSKDDYQCDNTGAPLFYNGELVGVLSFGMDCKSTGRFYTFTQVRFYGAWIKQQVIRLDNPKRRAAIVKT